MEITYAKITIDVTENNLPPVVYAKQGDSARGVAVTLTDGGAPYTLPANSTFMVNIRKSDGTVSVLSATKLDDYTMTAIFTPQTVAVVGRAIGEAAIYDENGTLLTSFLFFLRVIESAVPSDKITSSSEYAALAELLVKLTNADEAASVAMQRASEALATMTSYEAAEAQRVANENARGIAETARGEAETERAAAEAQRIANENARGTAETQRVNAEAQRVINENARIEEYAQFSEAIQIISSAEQAAADIKTLYQKMNVTLYADENGDLWIDETTTTEV